LCQFVGCARKQLDNNVGIGIWRTLPKGPVPKNTNQNTNHREFPPNSSKTKFPPNRQSWVPAKKYSTKNTNENTNQQVLVMVTYRYQPDSQYWGNSRS
jgi:hypothetical protein